MTRRLLVLPLVVAASLAPATARADTIVKIGVYSQNVLGDRAVIGAHIEERTPTPGRPASAGTARPAGRQVEDHVAQPPPYPAIASDAPLLRDPTPLGPGSLWYPDGSGHACVYSDGSSPLCYSVVGPGRAGPGAGIDPAELAAAVADRLELAPGRIHASPRTKGLTGAASWFWLDPRPGAETLTVVLGGERVTVTAEPEVEWRFGDGKTFTGSVGVPYQPGPPPQEAVTHTYETRCLPGDRRRNPYVLASCGQDGYRIAAVVGWRISYEASGPVEEGGSLPTRTTETAAAYPVSEARAFLLGGGSR